MKLKRTEVKSKKMPKKLTKTEEAMKRLKYIKDPSRKTILKIAKEVGISERQCYTAKNRLKEKYDTVRYKYLNYLAELFKFLDDYIPDYIMEEEPIPIERIQTLVEIQLLLAKKLPDKISLITDKTPEQFIQHLKKTYDDPRAPIYSNAKYVVENL